jgi:membrane protein DedA with SNARE-associated domain
MITDKIPDSIIEILSSDIGFIFLILIFILEGAMLMYALPSELIVPLGIHMFGDKPLTVMIVVGISIIGSTIGQTSLFYVSQKKGKQFIISSSHIPVSEEQLSTYEDHFSNYGYILVPITNTLPFVRGMMTIPAGLSELDKSKFILLSAIGTATFETLLALLYLRGISVVI